MTMIKKTGAVCALALLMLLLANDAFATHFRYGTITSRVPNPAQPNQIVLDVELAFRWSFFGNPNVFAPVVTGGALILEGPGFATQGFPLDLYVTSFSSAEDWFYGKLSIPVTLPATALGTFTASYSSGDRISTLRDGNHDTAWRVAHTFQVEAGGAVRNNGPKMTALPVRYLAIGAAQSWRIPVSDVDGDPVQFRLATSAESSLRTIRPLTRSDRNSGGQVPGFPAPVPDPTFSLSPSGVLSWQPSAVNCNPTAVPVSGFANEVCHYAVQVIATDGRGASVPLDFIIDLLEPSGQPPTMLIDGSSLPVVRTFPVGVASSLVLSGSDPDHALPETAIKSLDISSTTLPSGSITVPSLPTSITPTGLPSQASVLFSWSPGLGDIGTHLIEFAVDDGYGNVRTNSVTINVVAAQNRYVTGIIRDFQSSHADFNKAANNNATRLVGTNLTSDRKPFYNSAAGSLAVAFSQWFNDSAFSTKETLSLTATNGFSADPTVFNFTASDFRGGDKFFTYELHTYYTYQPGQVLHYSSADDLWVFINGRLAVDLSGVHTAPRSFTLNVDALAGQLGLSAFGTYEMDIFYAHRGATHVPSIGLDLPEAAICSAIGTPTATALPLKLGTAVVNGAGTRLISTATTVGGGAAWTATPQRLIQGFSAEFDFKIAPPAVNSGEGIAFVLQSAGATARGGDGANLGYAGIVNSIAVEFDTHQDVALGDPAYDHVSVHKGATGAANSANETFSLARSGNQYDPARGLPFNLNDGQLHHARIVYEPPVPNFANPNPIPADGWIRVWLDGAPGPAVEAPIGQQALMDMFPNGAYLGFTSASTTGTSANVDVSNFTLAYPQVSGALSHLQFQPQAQLPDMQGGTILITRDTCNAQIRSGGLAGAITATMTSDTYSTPVTITDLNDGRYQLSYTPRVGGAWILNVAINGVSILNNPAIVMVMPQAPSSVTVVGGTVPYTGAPRVATGNAVGVFGENAGPLTYTYNGLPEAIEAGTYEVVGTVNNSHYGPYNLSSASATATLVITKVAPTVTVGQTTVTYNGQSHAASGQVKGVMGETLGVPVLAYAPGSAVPVNAGNYLVTGTYAGNNNYNAGSATGFVKIEPATPLVTVESVAATFDGNAHPASATVTGIGGELAGFATLKYEGSIAPPVNAGTYEVIATFTAAGNYATASGTGAVVVAKATPTIEIASPTVTYDGAPHAVTGSVKGINGTVIGVPATFSYNGSPTVPSDAGTYVVTATFAETANYTAASATGSFTIAAATPTVTVNSASVTYNGTPRGVTGSVTGINGEPLGPLTFTYDGSSSQPADAKTYQVVASFAAAGNYASATGSGTLEITPATPSVTVIGGTVVYDAASHSATASVTGIGGTPLGAVSFTYNGSAALPVNAGSYAVVATVAANGNYTSATGTGTFEITRATPAVQVTGGPFVYNAGSHAAGAIVTGVNGVTLAVPAAVTYGGSTNAPIDAGTHAVEASIAETVNYTAATGAGSIVITKATPVVEVAAASFTYDGSPHGTTGTVKGVNNAVLGTPGNFTYNGSATLPADAASYAVSASFPETANYTAAVGAGVLTINPATPTVVVNSTSVVYNGNARAATGTVIGIGGASVGTLTFTYDGNATSPVNAKLYQVVGSFAGAGNYGPATGQGTLTITRAAAAVTITGGTFTYDGLTHAAVGTVTGINGTVIGTPTLTYNGSATAPKNVGTYAVAGSVAMSQNYTAASATGTIAITKAPLTITADAKTMTQGSTVPALTASYAGLVNGETAAVLDTQATLTTTASSSSAVGTYPITVAGGADANYTITRVAGVLTVTPSDITPGLMLGNGFVRDDDNRYDFEFVVRERANGTDRGGLELRVKDEDRRGNKKKGAKDRDDRFVSRRLTNVVFSDDPSVRPGRSRLPQVDTVLFAGTGEWNGRDGYRFEAFAQDLGEPGRHRETLRITVFDSQNRIVAQVEGDLDGGNIQSARIRH